MWATGYDHDQAYAAQSQSLKLGCLGEANNNDFINFTPVQAPSTQWWYPEDVGAGRDGVYSECSCSPRPPTNSTDIGLPADGDTTPSASSSSITGSQSRLWHSLTAPMSDMENTGTGSVAYIGSLSGIEQSMDTSWGDDATFEPYLASYPSESVQFQSVRPFLQVTMF